MQKLRPSAIWARRLTVAVPLLGVLFFFQNCDPFSQNSFRASFGRTGVVSNSTNQGTSNQMPTGEDPVTPTPQPPPVVTTGDNKVPPVITQFPAAQTIYVGMEGKYSGTKGVSVAVKGNGGAGEPGQILTLDCKSLDNRLQVNCGGFTGDTAVMEIMPKEGQECFGGSTQIEYFVIDQDPTNAQAPKLQSATYKLQLTMVDTCLSEAKVYGGTIKSQDNLGESVAISGNYAAAAAVGDDDGAADSGAVHVYQKSSGNWTFQQKLKPSQQNASDKAGPVALDGSVLVVGSPITDASSGIATVFEWSGSQWSEVATLSPGGRLSSTQKDLFGAAVAVQGDWIAVGSYQYTMGSTFGAGSVSLFAKSGGSWNFVQEINSPSPKNFEQFGFALAFDGDRLVVGAPANDTNGLGPGAVYSFRYVNGQWSAEANIDGSKADGGGSSAVFGSALALDGDNLIVGAYKAKGAANNSGAAYYYAFSGGQWQYKQKISHPGSGGDEFARNVSLSGGRLVASAQMQSSDRMARSGSVYYFKLEGGKFNLSFRILARDRAERDYFGSSVAVDGSTVFVGSRLDDGPPKAFSDGAGSSYFIGLD
ncbi:MAG: FG-GAP repeat protein [Bdellovibrionales bacterium]|nr:FG-GAP repeat protein [Bdellovibrionales bacterium]